ncbi:MAG: 2-dehydropantoate 2-reductase [Clostridiaceae bacterium]|nr:2-dehydropantoate 2-reductase [Clostridiaceae bacterium]
MLLVLLNNINTRGKGIIMKYLIIGTGGIGASIGGFLASNNNHVDFIARGENLEHIKKHGLKIKSGIKGELNLPKIRAFSGEEYVDKADVIFICVKSYSINDIIPIIKNVSHENSLVIPLMNGYGIGERMSNSLNGIKVIDGCIYISAFIDAPGSIVQLGSLFKIVFGTRKGIQIDSSVLNDIKNTLVDCGINTILSEKIEADTFQKFSFVSPCAACGAYYDITVEAMQEDGEYRETFKELCEEIKQIGNKLELNFDVDITEASLKVLDSLNPDSTSSMQKDIKAGRKAEIDGQIFDVVRLANNLGVEIPVYYKIAKHFGYAL